MAKSGAIRVGDKFRHTLMKTEWEVTRDAGFGRIELFCAATKRFGFLQKRDLRNSELWVRV